MATSAFGEVPSDGGRVALALARVRVRVRVSDGSHGMWSCNKRAVPFSFHRQPPQTWLAFAWAQGGETDEGRFSCCRLVLADIRPEWEC